MVTRGSRREQQQGWCQHYAVVQSDCEILAHIKDGQLATSLQVRLADLLDILLRLERLRSVPGDEEPQHVRLIRRLTAPAPVWRSSTLSCTGTRLQCRCFHDGRFP